MPAELIPGGATEQAAIAGGRALALQLSTLIAGHRIETGLYALVTQLIGLVLVSADSLEEAKSLFDTIGRDVLNGVELNWDQHAAARAAGEIAGSAVRLRQ
jgi:hypothetical protein